MNDTIAMKFGMCLVCPGISDIMRAFYCNMYIFRKKCILNFFCWNTEKYNQICINKKTIKNLPHNSLWVSSMMVCLKF